jgi:3-phenylpropionate/trans-cinnamate dioxygenase ferredoxin subunit
MRWDHGGRTYALYHSPDGEFFCTDGLCTHENVHLAGGLVMDYTIECPKHNGQFEYRTGAAKRAPVLREPAHLPGQGRGRRACWCRWTDAALVALDRRRPSRREGQAPVRHAPRRDAGGGRRAAEAAGVELLSVPPAMILDRRFREVAPKAFAFPGDNFFEIGGTERLPALGLPAL